MKKVLFATTALVAFAGAAAAEVTLTGNAEMGIIDSDADGFDIQFHTDIDVTFTMSGETDGGVAFGATIDLDESDTDRTISGVPVNDDGSGGLSASDIEVGGSPAFDNTTQGGETIFLSGSFGTVTMGDTDGALDWAMTEVAFNSGSINDDETSHGGYNGNAGLDGVYDGQILRYDYTAGAFGFAASIELNDNDGDDGDLLDGLDGDAVLALGVKYDLDLGGTVIGLGLGYQTTEVTEIGDLQGDHDIIGLSANTSFAGGLTVGINYSDFDRPDASGLSGDHFGIGVGYTSGPLSVSANYGIFDFDSGAEADGLGLSAGYDLGGGAIVQAGYGYTDGDGATDDLSTYSVGFRFNF